MGLYSTFTGDSMIITSMCRQLFFRILLLVFVVGLNILGVLPPVSFALDCNNPPTGFGGSWARTYKNWCESCGGTYSSAGPSCSPGSNWGGRLQSPSYQSQQPFYDYEAERRRQLEAEQQKQQEREGQRKRDEEARKKQEEFERSKQDALKSMKGISENELGLKGLDSSDDLGLKGIGNTGTGGLGLKGIGDAPSRPPAVDLREIGSKPASAATAPVVEPSATEITKGIEAARKRIPELERDVKGLQTLLKQFGASMRGNISEFEKWQETFHAAADNSLKNAKEYGLSMFLQYNLLGSLERSVKKDVFGKLDAMINTSDPKMRRWLGAQIKKRNLELDLVKQAVTAGTLGSDLKSLLSGSMRDDGKALDALLFVNDLMEATKVVSWSASQYFQQAKMIGETYTDLAAFGYSAVNVRKVEKTTEAFKREIQHLSTKLRDSVKEMNCLKGCLDKYTERCLDKCTGKTRFGSPPPLPR